MPREAEFTPATEFMYAFQPMRSLRNSIAFLVLITGGSGFLLGALTRPNWQVAVESAQVLAGVVLYPLHNSFYIYHVKLWTLVNQLLALPLALGASERLLSILVSGGIAALSFVAVGLCAFAVSRDAYWGIAAPILVNFSGVREMLAVNYPMDFMGTPHTYGAVALGWSVATLSLVAMERYSIAGLFLGLAPAIHPSMGVWCWIILCIALLWQGDDLTRLFRKLWRPVALGAFVSTVSLILQLAWMRPVLPHVDASTEADYVATWVSFFDFHRRAVDFGLPGVQLTIAALLIGLCLIPFLDEDDIGAVLLTRLTVVTSMVALAGAVMSRMAPSSVPPTLLTLMPTRLFLLSNLLFVAALFGFVTRFQSVWVRMAGLLLVISLATASPRTNVYGLIVSGIVFVIWKSIALVDTRSHVARWVSVAAGIFIVLWGGRAIAAQVATAGSYRNAMIDRTNSPVLMMASRTNGLIAIGTQCCPFTQMRTRRPLLVETMALDQIMYAPESAPDMNAALKAVYGVDLLHPVESLRSPGFEEDLTPVTRPIWEQRTREEWKKLAAVFGFTAVLANPTWMLQLPEIARDSAYVLYDVR